MSSSGYPASTGFPFIEDSFRPPSPPGPPPTHQPSTMYLDAPERPLSLSPSGHRPPSPPGPPPTNQPSPTQQQYSTTQPFTVGQRNFQQATLQSNTFTRQPTQSNHHNSTPTSNLSMGYGGVHLAKFNQDLLKALRMKCVKRLGTGFTGSVYLIRNISDELNTLAIKVFDLRDDTRAKEMAYYFHQEVSILRELDHACILPNITPMQCPEYAAICMPHCAHGSLDRRLGQLARNQILDYFLQLAAACVYIHARNIIHRDIKLENILLKTVDRIQLCDFGMSCRVPLDGLVTGTVGTVSFMAPEIKNYSDTKMPYNGISADSYACGVVLCSLLVEQYPKASTNLVESIHKSTDGSISSDSLEAIALQLLEDDTYRRANISYFHPMLYSSVQRQ